MEDKVLVERAKKGEKDAYGLLYKKYFHKVFRYCKFNTKSEEEAKDVCQDAFVKAYKKISDFKTNGVWSFQAFVFTIARNLIIDATRKKKEANIDDYENLQSDENLFDKNERHENIEKVKNVLSKLEEIERQIVLLRFFEEMPSSEVAKILGMNDGALRVRTHRVMQKMKDLYEVLYGKRN